MKLSSFDRFWEAYPKKKSKGLCNAIWKRKNLNKLSEKIINKVNEYKETKQWQDTQYIPYPSTFLNQGRWDDVILEEEKVKKQKVQNPIMPTQTTTYNLPKEEGITEEERVELKNEWQEVMRRVRGAVKRMG